MSDHTQYTHVAYKHIANYMSKKETKITQVIQPRHHVKLQHHHLPKPLNSSKFLSFLLQIVFYTIHHFHNNSFDEG